MFLNAFNDLSGKTTWQAANPLGPPPMVQRRENASAFQEQIAALHENLYTMPIPDVRSLTPALDEFVRALEFVFQTQAEATMFWSCGDSATPVHHDNYDIIVLQVRGRKKWFISTDPSHLPNKWKQVPGGAPRLDRYAEVETTTGTFLYLPRGTTHRVEGIENSMHISIGFTPVTLRDAIGACVDHLSDLLKPLREITDARIASQVQTGEFGELCDQVRQGVALLSEYCRTDNFIIDAMQRRSSRVIGELKRLASPDEEVELSTEIKLYHSRLAISHLSGNARIIDFAYPGEHRYIHRGAERAVLFIAQTPEFKVRDLSGEIDNAVRIALARELVTNGFLEIISMDR